ncbi:D-alanyl-D-alanine carboxypeptidase [Jeotgalibacillus alimentarius]|uniref:D-alanyl-D-alanine carboxypeptidase n=1 Tax=Jeotgalibacillus alimentarius TaxID=135826 RepID=A0A0C2VX56_9BACL|nr:D-alanyl-D-alanine carboxypeptidase family protein [Jeotgalibacillus alimentarius]KIL48976.1 D-alanyl-D-alanine carboxypeptidase [Jeotgalibacillus alimentarius]
MYPIKKILAICIIFLLICQPVHAIDVSAQSSILIEAESGRVIFHKNEHEKLKIASITKIMTAHAALKHGNINDQVKISAKASSAEGSSLYLKQGDTISLKDLLYGLLLRSGNDAAVAIAEHISGSVEKFAELMNKEAKALQMTNSYFTNPHGLDTDDKHVSTAYDMAILTKEAIKNDQFKAIFSSESYKPSSDHYQWNNKHRLLTGLYPYADGGKTGFTKKAGRTLVTTATKNNITYIAVTINAPDDWNDHIALFEDAFRRYAMFEVISKGPVPVLPGTHEHTDYISREVKKVPLTEDETKQVVYHITQGHNPSLSVYVQDEELTSVKLYADQNNPPAFYQTLIRKMKEFFTW